VGGLKGIKKKVVKVRNPGLRSEGPFSRREEGWELGEEKECKRKQKPMDCVPWVSYF
jgi:hypothetical protein